MWQVLHQGGLKAGTQGILGEHSVSTYEDNGSPRLEFSWGPTKASSNIRKHGVSFLQAATVLTDPLALTVFDSGHSEFEERWFTLGLADSGKLLAVSHTYSAVSPDSAQVRIISAREATRAERRQYEDTPR